MTYFILGDKTVYHEIKWLILECSTDIFPSILIKALAMSYQFYLTHSFQQFAVKLYQFSFLLWKKLETLLWGGSHILDIKTDNSSDSIFFPFLYASLFLSLYTFSCCFLIMCTLWKEISSQEGCILTECLTAVTKIFFFGMWKVRLNSHTEFFLYILNFMGSSALFIRHLLLI
jgi:hypothetical protein